MSLDFITQSLAGKVPVSVSHDPVDTPATWRDALKTNTSSPQSFELLKTLVYKPKTAKTAVPVPVIVIARDESEINTTTLGKTLDVKELRLAHEDLLQNFFALDKDSRMLFWLPRDCG
jgi:prolyl-tRNA synthetase